MVESPVEDEPPAEFIEGVVVFDYVLLAYTTILLTELF